MYECIMFKSGKEWRKIRIMDTLILSESHDFVSSNVELKIISIEDTSNKSFNYCISLKDKNCVITKALYNINTNQLEWFGQLQTPTVKNTNYVVELI